MKIYAFPRFILFLIVSGLSPVVAHTQDNEAASTVEKLLGTPYSKFADYRETASGEGASCISVIQYALTELGHDCPQPDFKVYFHRLKQRAELFEPGVTRASNYGIILFNKSHFSLLFEDLNGNGVIDYSDTIVHARFEPLRVDPLSAWLEHDPSRPVYAVILSPDFECP